MIENLTQLVPAATAKATAINAEKDIQLKTVAHAINTAANTGCTEVKFNQPLLDEVKAELEGQGYKVYTVGLADPDKVWMITWCE